MTLMIRIGNIAPVMVITSYATSEGSDESIPPRIFNRACNTSTLDVCNPKDLCTCRLTIVQTGKARAIISKSACS